MSEEIKNVELVENENTTTEVAEQTENVELAEQTEQTEVKDEEKEELQPLPEQKPFILSRQEQIILDEMERRATENPELAKGLKDKDKSIQECYAFITHRAKKMAEGNSAMIEDSVVFAWAMFYYTQRREIIDLEYKSTPKPSAPVTAPKAKDTKTKDTKKTAPAKKETPKAETKPAEPTDKDDEDDAQLSLF